MRQRPNCPACCPLQSHGSGSPGNTVPIRCLHRGSAPHRRQYTSLQTPHSLQRRPPLYCKAGLAPSHSPAALLSFTESIVYRQSKTERSVPASPSPYFSVFPRHGKASITPPVPLCLFVSVVIGSCRYAQQSSQHGAENVGRYAYLFRLRQAPHWSQAHLGGGQSRNGYHDYPFKACIDFVRQLHSILLSPEVRAHGRCRGFAPSRLHQSIICPPLSLRSRQGRRGGRPLYPGLRLFSGAHSCICGSDWV